MLYILRFLENAEGDAAGSTAWRLWGGRNWQVLAQKRPGVTSPRRRHCAGVLATAILAQQHSDVWDAAAMLLREHSAELTPTRQASLLETLAAAASLMQGPQKSRPGAGCCPKTLTPAAPKCTPCMKACRMSENHCVKDVSRGVGCCLRGSLI